MAFRNLYALSTENNEYSWISLNRRTFENNIASTLMFDVKYTNFRIGSNDDVHSLLGRDTTSATTGRFGLFIQQSGRTYFWKDGGIGAVTLPNFPSDEFITITITKSRSNYIKIYYNENEVESFQESGDWQNVNTIIGKYSTSTTGTVKSPNAIYDNIKLFNYELTQDEVRSYIRKKMTGNERGLTCLFQLEEGSGTKVIDNSSFKVDGTSVNMSYVPAEVDLPTTKSFVHHNNQYKTYNNLWKPISTTLPSKDTFMSDGMRDLSVLGRKEQTVSLPMTSSSLGEGRVFKTRIDYKKYFALNKIDVK